MTFSAPLFLLAALAGLIPVLLHMMHLQRAPEIPFSTLRFLRVSVEQTRRRKYLHDLLLLFLRCGALVLIAVGLAQPVVHRLGRWLSGGSNSAIVIVLDNSASMATRDATGLRWERALASCLQLLDQSQEGDEIALLVTCGPQRSEDGVLVRSHEVIRQLLETVEVSAEHADLVGRVQQARSLVEQATVPNREIYVVSDLQAASWQGLRDAAGRDKRERTDAAQRTTVTQSDRSLAPIVVIDVHGAPLPNVGLKRLEVRAPTPIVNAPLQVHVEIEGDATTDQERCLELLLDGRRVQISPTLTLRAGATTETTFEFQVEKPGVFRGEVQLTSDDAASWDDRLFFVLNISPSLPVGIVKSPARSVALLDDAYYLEKAASSLAEEDQLLRITTFSTAELATADLNSQAVVFLVNPPALEQTAATRVREYLRQGGNVVWFAGTNVDVARYTSMNEAHRRELVPGRLTDSVTATADQPEGWRIAWWDDSHPWLKPFTMPGALFETVRVRRFLRFATVEPQVRLLAKLDDGSPLLLERRIGAGTVIWCATAPQVDWTNLPLRPIFLPLIARLTLHLCQGEPEQSQFQAGAPIELPLPLATERSLEIVLPTDRSGQAAIVRLAGNKPEQSSVRLTETFRTGIYVVRGSAGVGPRALAVNVAPEEVAPGLLNPAELATNGLGERFVWCGDPSQLASTIRSLREGESLVELFLFGVLVLLVVEPWLANVQPSQQRIAATSRA